MVPCFCHQLERNRRYKLENEQQPFQLVFSTVFQSQIFSSNLRTKTCSNAFSSLEKILETIFALVEALKIDFSKITFLPFFGGFQRKTQKNTISELQKNFHALKIAGNDFSPNFSCRKVVSGVFRCLEIGFSSKGRFFYKTTVQDRFFSKSIFSQKNAFSTRFFFVYWFLIVEITILKLF